MAQDRRKTTAVKDLVKMSLRRQESRYSEVFLMDAHSSVQTELFNICISKDVVKQSHSPSTLH